MVMKTSSIPYTIKIIIASLVVGALSGVIAAAWMQSLFFDYVAQLGEAAVTTNTTGRIVSPSNQSIDKELENIKERALGSVVQLFEEDVNTPVTHGVVLTSDGWILTAGVTQSEAADMLVYVADDLYSVEEIVADTASETLLLKIKANSLPVVGFAQARPLLMQKAYVGVGHESALTSRVVEDVFKEEAVLNRFIRIDSEGKIGSPVFNGQGELIGIMNDAESLNLMIPTQIILSGFNSLLTNGSLERADLNIETVDIAHQVIPLNALEDSSLKRGAYVQSVKKISYAPNSESELEVGDVILSVGGEVVNREASFGELILSHEPGAQVRIVFLRDKEEMRTDVLLGQLQL